ncbi:DUF6542 domain-containing protein [Streptoalloteichus hindustanus]|uniref:DUF6542 domain-containing protein n=1 Tax=Streptoalloteichus hindustanus TaxID=2017 RepID=UPI00116142F3|nr:DUF6542 domain-containing protein [Streptoalloteichus hindustanus]
MTAIRDRRSDLAGGSPDGVPLAERSVFGKSRGLPWWGAVLLAFGLTGVSAFVDMEQSNALGMVFKVAYFVGCLLAVCWVRRRSLFGPMVQPPLVLAVAVPVVVLIGSGAPGAGGMSAKLLAIGAPLINGFPTMAVTTGVTLGVGLLRVLLQKDRTAGAKREPAAAADDAADERERDAARAGKGARGAGPVGSGRPAAKAGTPAARGAAGGSRQGAAAPQRQAAAGRPQAGRAGTQRRPRPRNDEL